MKETRTGSVVFVVCLVWAVIVLPRLFTGRWSPEAESAIVWAGGLLRIAFLAVAAWASARTLHSLDARNPARSAQAFLAGGFTVYLIAQGTLFGLTIASGGSPPYPSVADLGFFLAMLMLVAGVALAIRAWLSLGLFPDGGRQAAIAAGVAAVPMLIGTIVVLRSFVGADLPPLQVAADLTYPVLDSILVILAAAMLRLTVMMGRGSVGVVWKMLLVGFLAMALGDVAYSFFAGFELDALDPVIDLLYTVAYGLYVLGTLMQLRLVRQG
jgi:hypothetical protein